MAAVGQHAPLVFWSVGEGYLLEWAAQVLASDSPPLVHSISYGGNERGDIFDTTFMDRMVCTHAGVFVSLLLWFLSLSLHFPVTRYATHPSHTHNTYTIHNS
jgi:hypothetical protein